MDKVVGCFKNKLLFKKAELLEINKLVIEIKALCRNDG